MSIESEDQPASVGEPGSMSDSGFSSKPKSSSPNVMAVLNQRRFTRVPFLHRAQVEIQNQILDVQCMDLSLRGVLLVLPEESNWRLEQPIRVTLTLGGDEKIVMDCSVAHIDEDVVGCACDSMSLESLTVLRRVLELNLPDPDRVHRELAELMRLRDL
ncbi:MAG: PilZ domain-containing protein [Oceanobacter sp.]